VRFAAVAARARPVSLLGQGDPHRFRGNNAANGGVLNLQLDRFREVAAINLYMQPPLDAAGADAPLPPGRPTEVRRLCQALTGKDPALRISSARRLGILRDRAAAPALLKALGDPAAEVRLAAALSLSACGDAGAVEGLLGALGDPHPLVDQAVHVALSHITGRSVPFDAFAPNHARAVRAWRQWGADRRSPRLLEPIVARLTGDDPSDVQQAMETLGRIGGARGAVAIRHWLAENSDADLRVQMAAMRALGHLRDAGAVGLLAGILNDNIAPGRGSGFHELGFQQKPVYLAATAAEALGRIGKPQAEKALLAAWGKLHDFWHYTYRTGDHSWLMGCHSSVVHYRILEALDAMGSGNVRGIVGGILRSVPIDTDRGLLLENDAYEILVSRVVQRSGLAPAIMETCLAVLGDAAAKPSGQWKAAVTASPPASSCGRLCPEARAAHIASVVCLDSRYAKRLRAAFQRCRAAEPSRKRSWTCFFLARTLGKLGDRGSVPALVSALVAETAEAGFGLENPPSVFVYKAMTPFYRAAAADALGRIGDPKAAPTLLKVVADFDNAVDVRHAAAGALVRLADRPILPALRKLAGTYPEVATRRALLEACERAGR